MTRLLNNILLLASTLLLSIPLYAKHLPGDSLIDNYVRGLQTAVEQKIKANEKAAVKDFLVVYEEPKEKFITDFVNSGQYFWFAPGSAQETKLRQLTNSLQQQTGGEPLYVVLASVYNYDNADDVKPSIQWSAKDKYQPARYEEYQDDGVWKRIIPAVNKKTAIPPFTSVLYIISYFTKFKDQPYKVSHKCYYNGSSSLLVNGFQLNATDKVASTNTTTTNANSTRVAFLETTITAVADGIAKFGEELKKVNEQFAKLPATSPGMQFYNDYKSYCTDQLVLKKLALLIDQMGYEAYAAYLADKKTGSSYDPGVFRSLFKNLNDFNESYKKLSANLPDIKTAGELVKALNEFTSTELGVLKYPERIKAIKILNQLRELSDNSLWHLVNFNRWGNWMRDNNSPGRTVVKSEDYMIALVTSTPVSQQALLLADLKGKDGKYQLLKDLFFKLDDEPVGEGSYSTLIQYVASFVVANADETALSNLYENNRIYSWDDAVMRNILDNEGGTQSSTVTLNGQTYTMGLYNDYYQYKPDYDNVLGASISKYRTRTIMEVSPEGSLRPKRCSTCIGTPVLIDVDHLEMFDLIALIPEKTIDFKTGFAIQADQVTVLPAFFLKWYFQKDRNKKIKTGINFALTAVTLATGVGTLVSAASWTARILAVADMVFTTTYMLGEEYPQFNTFMKENLGPNGYDLFKTVEFGVNMFTAGRGAVALGKGAFNTVKKISIAFADMLKSRPDFLAKFAKAYPKRFEALANWLKDKSLGGVDLAALAAKAGSKFRAADFLAENKILLEVTEETTIFRSSHFKNSDDVMHDPNASFLETDVPSGGGGSGGSIGGGGGDDVLVLVRETKNATVKVPVDQSLTKMLAEKQMLSVGDKLIKYTEVPTYAPSLAAALKAGQAPQKAATLKIMQDVSNASKVLILEVPGESSQLLYATGPIKAKVEEYIKTKTKEKEEDKCDLCEAEPLICVLEQTATCAERTTALRKLCAQLSGLPLKAVCVKLQSLALTELNTFLADLVNNKPSNSCTIPYTYLAQSVSSVTPGIIAAWEMYRDASRNCIRVSMDNLQKVDRAWNDPNVLAEPYSFTREEFVGIMRAAGSAGLFSVNIDNTIFDNLRSFCRLEATFTNMDRIKAKLQQLNSGATLEGFNFIIRYMGEHPDVFNGGIIAVEEYQQALRRYADATDNRDPLHRIFYEFKSVKEMEANFAEQFTKDLATAPQLDQLRWVFDRNKMSESQVLSAVLTKLKADSGKEQLNTLTDEKKTLFFSGYDPVDNPEITDAQIETFIRANFATIFKID